MKKIPVLCCFVLIAQVFSMALSTRYVKAQNDTPENPGNFVPGEIVVAFKSGKTTSQYAAAAAEIAKKTHTRPVKVGAGGVALLRGDKNADVKKLANDMEADPNVLYAEPNYIYRLPDESTNVDVNYLQRVFTIRKSMRVDNTGKETDLGKLDLVPITYLRSLKTQKGITIQATYPNDPYLWWNSGWDVVDADVVSSNTTFSAGVCVLDTGVDYLHPDLSGKILIGYDFVNADVYPMDDNGHGTHVAGIISAKPNNSVGIAGASRANVVAVKVLGTQGWGTTYDIAMGINHCANRTDVKVLNMSFGSQDDSEVIYNAVNYAVNTKGKLVVTSAGNGIAPFISYPAYYADNIEYPEFANKVLAVAASGQHKSIGYYYYTDYDCQGDYSNYGHWVSVVAPGTDIYSTMPYDRPFYMNYFSSINPRYDYLGGTSMSTAFVSAAAARRWGYKPLESNAQVAYDVINSGWEVSADGSCWPSSMEGKHQVNIANLMERFATEVSVADASTGMGLTGAVVQVYKGTTLLGSAVIVPYTMGYTTQYLSSVLGQKEIFKYYTAYTTITNIPIPTNGKEFHDIWNNGYTYKASKSGYTSTPQPVWQHLQSVSFMPATLYLDERAGIPPKTSNIEVVLGFQEDFRYYSEYQWSDTSRFDLDLDVWLPSVPNPLDASQIAPFIVGPEGNTMGYLENDPTGNMNVFPFARLKREGRYGIPAEDFTPVHIENTTISSRKAHAPLAANSALPYYPGDYAIGVTDWDQTIDHDADENTPEIPLLGAWAVPYVYIWKDGVVKMVNAMPWQPAGEYCNAHWWRAATITSGVSGAVTYTPNYECNNTIDIFPYSNITP